MIYKDFIDPSDECAVRHGSSKRGHIGSRMTRFDGTMFMEHLLQVDFPEDSLHVVLDTQEGNSIEVDAHEGDEYVMSYFYVDARTYTKRYITFSNRPLLRENIPEKAALNDLERERVHRRALALDYYLDTKRYPDIYRNPVFYHRWSMKELKTPPFLDSEMELKE